MNEVEYRVTYQREGGKKQYRTFQRRKSAMRFMADLEKATRTDLAPLIGVELHIRPCGQWMPLKKEGTS